MLARRPALSLTLAVALAASIVPSAFAAPVRPLSASPSAVSVPAPPAQQLSSAETTRLADNTLIVRVKGSVTADKLSRIYRSADTSAGAVRVIRRDALAWRAPSGTTPAEFAEQLEQTGQVEYASPNYLRFPTGYTPPAFASPNDPAYTNTDTWGLGTSTTWYQRYPLGKSWWIRNVTAVNDSSTNAWKRGYTGATITGKHPLRAGGDAIKVAVIDTGFYFDHPDAGSNIEAGTADVTPVDPSKGPYTGQNAASDNTMEVSHGTCVAGEIAAATGNGVGTAGVANDTTVRVYKVYFGGAGVKDSDIIISIYRAVDDGCKVINMSLAGSGASAALQDACDYAYSQGCIIVAASGNNGGSSVYYPAACDHVLAVGSIGLKGDGTTRARSSFSNGGSKLDLVAPGEFIWGLVKPGFDADGDDDISEPGYTWWQGTSMASPIVAGGIAWLWRAMPTLSNASMISIVESTARDLGASGRDNSYGYGELNMDAAYAKLIANYPLLKKPTLSATVSDNARNQRLTWSAVSGYKVTYDVAVDGDVVLSGLTKTSAVLPHDTTPVPHTVTVSPVSPRNWADGTEVASVQIDPVESVPEVLSLRYYRGALTWSDTEDGTVHTDLLSIDGAPASAVSGESTSTSGLLPGEHTATLKVRDNATVDSAPYTHTFTVRESPTVKRVTASDAPGYAAKLSASRASASATTAVLVGSGSWTGAAVAAPLASVVDGPVLIGGAKSLPSATKAELKRLGVTDVIVVGSTAAVGTSSTKALKSAGYHVSRISGSDRYATAAAVATAIAQRSGGTIPGSRAVVVGDSPSDALSASAVAAREGWPLLFAKSTSIPSATRSALSSLGVTSTLLVARTSTVNGATRAQLPSATRITASTSTGVGTTLATWATTNYPADFSGEQVFLANAGSWDKDLGLGAEAARGGALVLTSGTTLAGSVKSYYTTNSEVAVSTLVIGGSSTITDSAITTIKKLVGAP